MLSLQLSFSGGAELLVGNTREHAIKVENVKDVTELLAWIRDNLLQERPELFLKDKTVRPGILVLVNDADWELLGQGDYELQDGDNVTFISTLHGG